jgi:hypothetical protein
MKSMFLLATLFTTALFLFGCANPTVTNAARKLNHEAEASGSPYRYRTYNMDGGTVLEKYRITPPSPTPVPANLQPTTANPELRTDVLNRIAAFQQGWGNTNAPILLGVKSEGIFQNSIKESWFIKQDDGAIEYKVTMKPSPQGGTDFELNGP